MEAGWWVRSSKRSIAFTILRQEGLLQVSSESYLGNRETGKVTTFSRGLEGRTMVVVKVRNCNRRTRLRGGSILNYIQ